MIYNRTIKLILEELEYKLAIQSNECKIYHKNYSSSFEETTESWDDMIRIDQLLTELAEINPKTISYEALLELIKNCLQLLNEVESKTMYA